jgi:putative drug exporter of the RND superfamily
VSWSLLGKMISVPILRRPRVVLIAALMVIAVLSVIGFGVEDELRPTSAGVPGTEAARASGLLEGHFGETAPFVILLRGPAASLDKQGPTLTDALRRDSHVTVVSPWDRSHSERLRPSPRKALIFADFHVSPERAVEKTVDELDRTLEEIVRPPVTATQTSFATLSRAIQDESVRSTRIAELVAVPLLLLVLLLVFRSPIAAAIPLVFGVAAVLAARGVIALAAPQVAIDGLALTVCSMMGLALGVDYALLIVSRFREELKAGVAPPEAARRTRGTAGRTTAFAGLTVALAMVVTLWMMPGSLFLSLAGAAILVTAISVAIAVFVAPPLLAIIGDDIDRWRLPAGRGASRLVGGVAGVLRRPRLAALLIGGGLLLLAAPALAFKTGPPSVAQLPESNGARQDAEAIDRAADAGWDAPFVVVAAASSGPITSPARLTALRRAQRQIAADPGVQVVIGPAQIARRVGPLSKGGKDLLAGRGAAAPGRLERLGERLGDAASGVARLRGGLSRAAAGAGLLATGSGHAGEGAAQLSGGLGRAASGAESAAGALTRLDRGSGRLAAGQRDVALGSRSLRNELTGLLPVLRRSGMARARRLRASLRDAAARDPSLAREFHEVERLVEALALARNQAKRAHALASRLHNAQAALAEGGAKLHRGTARLAEAAASLPAGLERLGAGATRLDEGLRALNGGAGALEANLAQGFHASRPLQGGLLRARHRVSGSAARLDDDLGALRRSSPRIFDSGYFALSALDGAPVRARQRASEAIDLAHGGQAARFLVVPRDTLNTPGSEALYGRLKVEAAELAAATGLQTGVAGGPAELADYTEAITSRIPLVILVISLVTFLALVLILRALPLAAIAVGLNLLTVAVAFGVLTLLFDLPPGWPLGGHTYVDAIGAAGIFGIVFGLSIDYAVFLLTRMRESWEAGATLEEAVTFGLQRTARVITGAAAIMLTVFVAFAAAPIATVSQLGTGLAVAVVLDATVVRIVLLPALMLIVGERVWWLPRPLERILPKLGFHPA